MVSLTPQFGSADNWVSRWNGTKQATIIPVDPPSHDPIPPFSCPLTFEGFTFAVWCQTQSPKVTWKSGGLITANVISGISIGGEVYSEIAKTWLTLGGVTIFRVPKVSQTCRLKFYPPYWFKSFAVGIWEYTGPGQPDLEAKLDSIYGKLP